jgi:cell division transport system permease protein
MAKKKTYRFRKNTVTSTLSMSMVLLLVGLVLMLLLVGRDMSTFVKENINLSIVLKDSINRSDEQRLEKFLLNAEYAKSVTYISKDEALKDHIASLGDNPAEFLGYNPLKASIEVKLQEKYATPEGVKTIEGSVKSFEIIDRVVYQKDMVSLVSDNVTRISYVLLGLAAILLFISIALINNTIRMSLYSNRFLINTMKLVGATPGFIRKPYMIKTMINSLIASVIAIGLLVGVVAYVQVQFAIPDVLIQSTNLIIVAVAVVLLGLLLSVVSSWISVGRYLRMTSNDLHII